MHLFIIQLIDIEQLITCATGQLSMHVECLHQGTHRSAAARVMTGEGNTHTDAGRGLTRTMAWEGHVMGGGTWLHPRAHSDADTV